MSKDKKLFAVGLITSLFFIWGLALNLNPILIFHLKDAFQLTTRESSLVDVSTYIAYFLLPIPAALFMKKYGYKGGILLGLTFVTIGMFLFYPAASVMNYPFFLMAVFIIASGAAFLETAANPYITVLGAPENAAFRINLAQSFNGMAAMTAGLVGRTFILSGTTLTDTQKKVMPHNQLVTYLYNEASSVKTPFLIIGSGVLIIVILIWFTSLPPIVEEDEGEDTHESKPFFQRMWALFKERELMAGVLAQFFYVGAQVCVWSFFLLFTKKVSNMDEKTASLFLIAGSAMFMLGRFTGTLLMKIISPVKLLTIYSFLNVLLMMLAIFLHGKLPIYALLGVDFFMSIMFPTIFSLGIRGLGKKTKEGSSFMVMSIVGGAACAYLLGILADATNIQVAYIIPGFCFLYIFIYSWKRMKAKDVVLTAGH